MSRAWLASVACCAWPASHWFTFYRCAWVCGDWGGALLEGGTPPGSIVLIRQQSGRRSTPTRPPCVGAWDAAKNLGPHSSPQGLVTNDVSGMDAGGAGLLYACLLNAQGRLLHDMFIHPIPGGELDGFWATHACRAWSAPARGPATAQHRSRSLPLPDNQPPSPAPRPRSSRACRVLGCGRGGAAGLGAPSQAVRCGLGVYPIAGGKWSGGWQDARGPAGRPGALPRDAPGHEHLSPWQSVGTGLARLTGPASLMNTVHSLFPHLLPFPTAQVPPAPEAGHRRRQR